MKVYYNYILKKYIYINEDSYKQYINIKKKNPNILPYQSYDMIKNGNIRYTTIDNILEYLQKKLNLKMID